MWMLPSPARLAPAQRAQQRQQEQQQPHRDGSQQQQLGSSTAWWRQLEVVLPQQPAQQQSIAPDGRTVLAAGASAARATMATAAAAPAVTGAAGTTGAADAAGAAGAHAVDWSRSGAWSAVWRRLRRTPAPREHRFLAWKVMHGSLPCAAWEAHVRATSSSRASDSSPLCHVPGCATAGHAETLSHVFLGCPAAAAVAQWVSQLWAAMTAGPGPPCVPQVFLAGDHTVWDPGPGELCVLWDIIRLAFLHAVWSSRCICRRQDTVMRPAQIAAQIVASLRLHMQRDFARSRDLSAAMAALSGTYMPDRRPLSADMAKARWCHRRVLAHEREEVTGRFVVRLTTSYPVPLPSLG